jgi:hypothetical protein
MTNAYKGVQKIVGKPKEKRSLRRPGVCLDGGIISLYILK